MERRGMESRDVDKLRARAQQSGTSAAAMITAYFASGALARIMTQTIVAPMDTVKVRLQFSQRGVRMYRTPGQALLSILRNEGVTAFFRGLPARYMYIGPQAGVSFLLYENFHHAVKKEKKNWFEVARSILLIGFIRFCGVSFRTPFDIVRQRMQVMGSLLPQSTAAAAASTAGAAAAHSATALRSHLPKRGPMPLPATPSAAVHGAAANMAASMAPNVAVRGHYSSTIDCFVKLIKLEGFRSLWTGIGITYLRDVPVSLIYYPSYDLFKEVVGRVIRRVRGMDPRAPLPLSAPQVMLAGAMSMACGVTLTIPLDVVKTRLQTQGSLQTKRYNGIYDCARKIVAEEGFRGLRRGMGTRMLYLCPNAAITFACYEALKKGISNFFFQGQL